MPTPDEMLATTLANFEQWRANRSRPTEPTPIALQKQATALLDHFSACQVTQQLNISGTNLRRWSGKKKNPVHGFVHMQPPPLETTQLQLEISFAGGNQFKLSGEMTPGHLAAITETLFTWGGHPQ